MSLITIKEAIRESTIDALSGIPGLSAYTFYNAPMGSIELTKAPYITVSLVSESGVSTSHRNPGFRTQFNLAIQLVYKRSVSGTTLAQAAWADAIEEAECLIQEGLFENATWLDQFVDVSSYSIEREQQSDGESLFMVSTITITVDHYIAYDANR